MVSQNFAVLVKFGFVGNACKILVDGCLLVFAYFDKCSTASFRTVFVASKVNFRQCLCSMKLIYSQL